jgi:hypothetical protein
MNLNYVIVLGSAVIPMIVGFIWYNPKVFGKVWMQESGMTMESTKTTSMVKIMGFSILFNLFAALALHVIVIHQMGIFSMLADTPEMKDPNSELSLMISNFMAKYGSNFRTFKHGALHGFITALMLVLPVIGTSALYEQRSWKYIFIHVGYWAVSLMLMGGVICAFA